VGGNNILPMKELVDVLESLGLQSCKTYIQSGNAVFKNISVDTKTLARKISIAIRKTHGFEPKVLLLDAGTLAQAIKSNPFPEAESEPNTLHLNFLSSVPLTPDLKALEKIRGESERFHLVGNVLYLHAPDGIGRSKLAANVERLLDMSATSRNWRTVCKIMEMATSA
jgi:uncharacterized protein (DUF1697 family)